MKYKIGRLATLFNVNSETIRYYEKQKLIKSYRDQTNNYRYFDDLSVQTLSSIKRYRNMNFSLNEIEQIHTNTSIGAISNLLDEKVEKYYIEKREKEAIIHKILENQHTLRNMDAFLNQPLLIHDKNFYVYSFKLNEESMIDNPITQFMINKFPLSSASTIIKKEKLQNREASSSKAFILEARHSSHFMVHLDSLTLIEMPLAIQLCIKLTNGHFDYEYICETIDQFINNHQLEICGDSYTMHLINYMQDYQAIHFANLFIPVKKLKRSHEQI
ncbi:MAG: MerR family transcriptional regulator [Erysipelotrichaceae bacterium]